jgi:hypothetical protein
MINYDKRGREGGPRFPLFKNKGEKYVELR